MAARLEQLSSHISGVSGNHPAGMLADEVAIITGEL